MSSDAGKKSCPYPAICRFGVSGDNRFGSLFLFVGLCPSNLRVVYRIIAAAATDAGAVGKLLPVKAICRFRISRIRAPLANHIRIRQSVVLASSAGLPIP